MTWFITFRTHPQAGGVDDGQVFQATAAAPNPVGLTRNFAALAGQCAGKDVLFATHGFNVTQESGVKCLAWLEDALGKAAARGPFNGTATWNSASAMFVGLLWPGSWWVKAVNYPFEPADALKSGKNLAALINNNFAAANSISFVSHSLGARLVLQAATSMTRTPREVCVLAAATDANSLNRRFDNARARADRISVLSSKKDKVLKLAYPFGDFFAGDPFCGALGYRGPQPANLDHVRHTWIAGEAHHPPPILDCGFDHGDYLPGKEPDAAPPKERSDTVARYVEAAFAGASPVW